MAWELRRYWPRKSAASPRISAKPAVARQCWPNAWLYSAFSVHAFAVLPDDGFEAPALRLVSMVYPACATKARANPRTGEKPSDAADAR